MLNHEKLPSTNSTNLALTKILQKFSKTRLHSSRMCTKRLLTVSPSMYCAGGVSAPRGAWSWGCLFLGGDVSGPGSVCSWGVSALRGVSQHTLRQKPLLTEGLTDRCKNITFTNLVCGR